MILSTPVAGGASLPIGFVRSLLTCREYTHVMQEGPSIPHNRNAIFERARLENDSVLMIDSDMVFTYEHVKKVEQLLETHDIVTGVAVMSWPGNPPAVFGENGKPIDPIPDIPFEIESCGAFFLGISKKVIDTLYGQEPFTPIINEEYGQYYGEDISFCMRVKKAGFVIHCDPALNIGHIKTKTLYYEKA